MAVTKTYVSDKTDSRRKRVMAIELAMKDPLVIAQAIAGNPDLLLGLNLQIIESICENKTALAVIEPAIIFMAKKCPHTYKVFAVASMK